MSQKLSLRLARLLNMVPYFVANPGITKAEAAAELGVSVSQLTKDLEQLWVCGLPGYGPGDLIDLSFEEETVDVTFSAGIDRPLRLTSPEATALLIALRALGELPGTADPTSVQGAIAKIESAAGVAAGGVVTPAAQPDRDNPVTATVRSAVRHAHALDITYFSASRDAVTRRVVDPIRVVLVDNNSYLQAWCRQADGVRLFRYDRIDAATELGEPARVPEAAYEDSSSLELFQDDATLPHARLVIAADHAWVLDYHPMTDVRVREDGSLEASMRYASADWMARLIVGFGAGVQVLDPPDLSETIRRRAEAALAMYEQPIVS